MAQITKCAFGNIAGKAMTFFINISAEISPHNFCFSNCTTLQAAYFGAFTSKTLSQKQP
jgi:hypothetical protein